MSPRKPWGLSFCTRCVPDCNVRFHGWLCLVAICHCMSSSFSTKWASSTHAAGQRAFKDPIAASEGAGHAEHAGLPFRPMAERIAPSTAVSLMTAPEALGSHGMPGCWRSFRSTPSGSPVPSFAGSVIATPHLMRGRQFRQGSGRRRGYAIAALREPPVAPARLFAGGRSSNSGSSSGGREF